MTWIMDPREAFHPPIPEPWASQMLAELGRIGREIEECERLEALRGATDATSSCNTEARADTKNQTLTGGTELAP